MTYVEDRGIWHVVDRDGESEVVTLCEKRLEVATVHTLDFEPKPLCWRCREAQKGI